jgi:hypothetical protein
MAESGVCAAPASSTESRGGVLGRNSPALCPKSHQVRAQSYGVLHLRPNTRTLFHGLQPEDKPYGDAMSYGILPESVWRHRAPSRAEPEQNEGSSEINQSELHCL